MNSKKQAASTLQKRVAKALLRRRLRELQRMQTTAEERKEQTK